VETEENDIVKEHTSLKKLLTVSCKLNVANFWDIVHIDTKSIFGFTNGIEGRLMSGHSITLPFSLKHIGLHETGMQETR
jgi:hypothetical protein